MSAEQREQLPIGSWARAGNLVGLVASVDGNNVTLFDPGDRHMARLPRSEVEPVPAAAVTITLTVDLPLAHGIGEETVRRWVATLTDDFLRERAYAALAEAGLDEGAALPAVHVTVSPMDTTGAICLCGARVPAPPGSTLPCPRCGREAVSAPGSSGAASEGSHGI